VHRTNANYEMQRLPAGGGPGRRDGASASVQPARAARGGAPVGALLPERRGAFALTDHLSCIIRPVWPKKHKDPSLYRQLHRT